jgi:hypothetical protein
LPCDYVFSLSPELICNHLSFNMSSVAESDYLLSTHGSQVELHEHRRCTSATSTIPKPPNPNKPKAGATRVALEIPEISWARRRDDEADDNSDDDDFHDPTYGEEELTSSQLADAPQDTQTQVRVSLPTCSYTVHQLGHMQHQLAHIQFLQSCYVIKLCGLAVSRISLIYSSNLQFLLKYNKHFWMRSKQYTKATSDQMFHTGSQLADAPQDTQTQVCVSLPTCSYTIYQLGHMQHQLAHIQFLWSCYVIKLCGLAVSGI